jgi:hypothetical protein
VLQESIDNSTSITHATALVAAKVYEKDAASILKVVLVGGITNNS